MLFYLLLGVSAIIIIARRKLYPAPYPDIPYSEDSAKRISGDIPSLVLVIKSTNEFSSSVFAITTQKLGTPISQLLFPGIRKPLITLEDPREIEDIVLRRNKEFDKAPTAIDIFSPMFPHASISQYTTPKLKAQKRLWADVMSTEFLRKAAAPNIHKATLELLDLWELKASTIYRGQAFKCHEDFRNAALDAIWVAVVGEEPGVTRYEINKLQDQVRGNTGSHNSLPPPRGVFLKEEVAYIGDTIARNSNSPVPKWSQKIETYSSRYRKFRNTVTSEISLAMGKAVERFQRLELGKLEVDELDTCMMDLVLRRQVVEAKKNDRSRLYSERSHLVCEIQTELRAALNISFREKLPSVTDILETNIPYLDAACEEIVRLAGVAKGNLRQAIVDTEILGYKIPKGAEIFMNYHIDRTPVPVARSKRSVGSQAAIDKHGDGLQSNAGHDLGDFELRRWLVNDKDTGKDVFNAYALPSIAFGGGYRGCAGRKLASMEIRIVVTLLILNFEFLELPSEYRAMSATEKIFRQPDFPYIRLRPL